VVKARIAEALKQSAGAVDRLRPPEPGAVVLIYHRVGRSSTLEVDLPTALFEEQMAYLSQSGRVVSIDTALDALAAADPPERDPIVVTFDDGTADFVDVAMPILERHRIPVTLYVATDFVDRAIPFPAEGTPLSWKALRDAQTTGLVTTGSHTHTHALLDRLTTAAIDEELDRSNDLIADQLGTAPTHFAYPKAVAGSAAADTAVRRRYRSAALAGTRPNPYGRTDPYRLARSPVQLGDGMRWFRAKAAGGMRLEDDVRSVANRWRYRGSTQ
jgi:peptidoglycan/xylan/chitin deacetylase (PgdA/CDA1 family)